MYNKNMILNLQNQKLKYFIYVRKSSESEDRQVASIESQIAELTKIAKEHNLQIVEVLSESKSAKAPGRPVFSSMIERINKGEASGIICWKLDRLARNPIDGGTISWLLQQNMIKHIQAYERSYYPTDNVLMMSVEFGMANQFINDLSSNVKRGLRTKAKNGWCPGLAKPGYLNDKNCEKGENRITEDPVRFTLLQRAFQSIITQQKTPAEALTILNNESGYRTLKRRRSGGLPMAKSIFYKILSDPFYYGWYEYPKGSGQWENGKHKPMITEDEFNKIQRILGRTDNSRPKSQKINSAFYGLFRCGDCDSAITPDEKCQTICSNCKTKFSSKHATSCLKCKTEIAKMKKPTHLQYLYYACTKKKNPNCSQKSLESKELEKQVNELLGSIKISEKMRDWHVARLNEYNEQEIVDKTYNQKTLQQAYSDNQKRLENLLRLKISPQNINGDILSDEIYAQRKSEIDKDLNQIRASMLDTDTKANNWMDLAVNTFNFACYAKHHFENGSIEDKKTILLALGSNLKLKDKKVLISLPKHFEIIQNANSGIREIKPTLEHEENGLYNGEIGAFRHAIPYSQGLVDKIGTEIESNKIIY